jgi:acyl-coenzyme A thioesterase PaaI-like protein
LSQQDGRLDGSSCFVCGPNNPIGLRLKFCMDGAVCRAEFTPDKHHVGFDGMIHGGILYSALDDVMANWLYLQGARGHTARCEIRYRAPLAVGDSIQLEGRLISRKTRLAIMEGKALSAASGTVIAEARGSFMIVDQDSAEQG